MLQVEIYQMITEDTEDLDVLDCRALQCARVCHSKRDKVCVGRGESAGGVGVSAAAGCASRPAPSAVSAGAKCRVGRRQVPWRPSAAEGLCRTAALESAARLLCRTAGRLAQGCHLKMEKDPSANLAN